MNQVYIYCPRKSEGAHELVKALEAKRIRKFDGLDFYDKRRRFSLEKDSILVCWGSSLPEIEGVKVLNALEKRLSKYQQWFTLYNAGVKTIQALKHDSYRYTESKLRSSGYVPRGNEHVGGVDLLYGVTKPDYWVQKEVFTKEYRIHSFAGRSIRAGIKVLRDDFKLCAEADWKPNMNLAHPWVRSFEGGWRIKYDEFKSNETMRTLAHAAVKALDLTFGAVDLAERPDGSIVVLEVNSAPGLEGGTTQAYIRAIQRWLKESGIVIKTPPTPIVDVNGALRG